MIGRQCNFFGGHNVEATDPPIITKIAESFASMTMYAALRLTEIAIQNNLTMEFWHQRTNTMISAYLVERNVERQSSLNCL